MRKSIIERKTKESDISIELNVDGNREILIDTPVPFLNHLLEMFAFYASIDLSVKASGDIEIDDHHTVEDIAIVLGKAVLRALGDKIGIRRYGNALIPMDEALSRVVLDISSRPYLVYDVALKRESIGTLSLENVKEFLYAFAMNSGITLHVSLLYGDNDHHKIESIFKGLGTALKEAKEIVDSSVTSTKGVL